LINSNSATFIQQFDVSACVTPTQPYLPVHNKWFIYSKGFGMFSVIAAETIFGLSQKQCTAIEYSCFLQVTN